MKSTLQNSEHYKWGNNCDSYVLLNNKNLSVKFEKMPPKTTEEKHFHKFSQQYFFIINGNVEFEITNSSKEIQKIMVRENEGIHIPSNTEHKILNFSENEIKFLVISQPSTDNDRENV